MPYYHDDGTEFFPEQLPLPKMCLKCRRNDIRDGDEEILCNLTRGDQAESGEFICYGFLPIPGAAKENHPLDTQ
jgi:hypothetical protein